VSAESLLEGLLPGSLWGEEADMTPPDRFPGYSAEAEVYDYGWSSLVEDIEFYQSRVGQPGRLLDLMCGTGRVGLAFARAGWEVDGIDLSVEVLRVAQMKSKRLPPEVRRRIRFHQGHLTEFRLPGRYDAAVIPVDSYPLILRRRERVRALRNIRRHLKASGRLMLHIDTPASYETARTGAPRVEVVPVDRGNRLYLRSLVESFVRPDVVRGIAVHVLVDRSGRVGRSLTSETRTRVLPIRRVTREVMEAGFSRTRLFGDYDGGGFTPRSRFAILEASP
jgi:SAM-dependent methyltransferase